jgi:hypothetical protein
MDTLFGLIEKEIEEPDKAIFHNVRALPGIPLCLQMYSILWKPQAQVNHRGEDTRPVGMGTSG